jgi:hypothetical protein
MSLESRIDRIEARIGGPGAYPAYIHITITDPLESEEAKAAISEALEKAKARGGPCDDPSIFIKGVGLCAIAGLVGDAVEVQQIIRGMEV